MLTTAIVDKIAKMYKEGAPDDHLEFSRVLRSSELLAPIIAQLIGEQIKAYKAMDVEWSIAAAIIMLEIGYKLAKTEAIEEAFNSDFLPGQR